MKAIKMSDRRGLLCACAPAFANVNVFACLPEWAALAGELGGNKVSVYQAATALQDPHRIEARPSLVARMRGADLVICTGAELEIGWLPVLLQTAGNQKVQPGQPGSSRPRISSTSWRYRPGSIAPRATSTLRAIRTCTSIRTTSRRSAW